MKIFLKKYQHIIAWLSIFLIVSLLYYPIIRGTFILDDYVWIESLNLTQIINLFTGSWEHGNTLRPFMRLDFFLSKLIFGESVVGWHMVNILLHTSISWFIYFFLNKISSTKILPILVALSFATIPTNHEVVAWISGQTHAWGLILSIIAEIFFYRLFTSEKIKKYDAILALVFTIVAFLTYEVSFVIPILLLITIIIFPKFRNKKNIKVTLLSFILLILLLVYRYFVLNKSMGSVGDNQENILLAPFKNFKAIINLFFYTKYISLTYLTSWIILVGLGYKRIIKDKNIIRLILWLGITSIIMYLPFSIINGVAPRFLYSSIFFFTILTGLLLINQKTYRLSLVIIVVILSFNITRTSQTVRVYETLNNNYNSIRSQVVEDYPMWPNDKDMLFYNIPNGIQDGKQSVLAFLTYFDKAITYGYKNQSISGKIYRAERLDKERLETILKKDPIIYKFQNFEKPLLKIN